MKARAGMENPLGSFAAKPNFRRKSVQTFPGTSSNVSQSYLCGFESRAALVLAASRRLGSEKGDMVSPECNTGIAIIGFQVVKKPVGKCRSV